MRCGAADPAGEWDLQAAVATLVGPDFQKIRLCNTVKPCPVEAIIGVMDLASERGHEGDLIGFTLSEAGDCFSQIIVIYVRHSPPFIPVSHAPNAPAP